MRSGGVAAVFGPRGAALGSRWGQGAGVAVEGAAGEGFWGGVALGQQVVVGGVSLCGDGEGGVYGGVVTRTGRGGGGGGVRGHVVELCTHAGVAPAGGLRGKRGRGHCRRGSHCRVVIRIGTPTEAGERGGGGSSRRRSGHATSAGGEVAGIGHVVQHAVSV